MRVILGYSLQLPPVFKNHGGLVTVTEVDLDTCTASLIYISMSLVLSVQINNRPGNTILRLHKSLSTS